MNNDVTILNNLDPNQIIYRFMGLDKFIYLICRKKLWFTRGDKLGDEHEGSLPKKLVDARNERLDKEVLQNTIKFSKIQEIKRKFENGSRLYRQTRFVSCWTRNDCESLLMWKIYTPNSTGVAIKSTVKRLSECFIRQPNDFFERKYMTISETIYEDYIDTDQLELEQIFYKRHAYAYENEIRAVASFLSTIETPDKMETDVDLDVLIDKIYMLSSQDSNILKGLVENLICKYNLSKEVLIPRFDIKAYF